MHFVRDSQRRMNVGDFWSHNYYYYLLIFISLVSSAIIHPHWRFLLIFLLEFSHSLLVKPENKRLEKVGGGKGGGCSHLMLVPRSPHWLRLTSTLSLQEPSQGWLLTPSLPRKIYKSRPDYLVRKFLPCAWNGPLSDKDLLSPILQP